MNGTSTRVLTQYLREPLIPNDHAMMVSTQKGSGLRSGIVLASGASDSGSIPGPWNQR